MTAARFPDGKAAADGYPSAAQGGRLSYAIFLLARAHRGYADQLLLELGLQAGHEHILLRLYERDGQSRTELLEALGLDDPTITEAISRLEHINAVQLVPPSASSPVSRVWLTDTGRALRHPVENVRAQLDATTLEALGAERAEAFIAMAQTIEGAITRR